MNSSTSGVTTRAVKEARAALAKSFFRRSLPCPPATDFASTQGKKLFQESLLEGYMEGFFSLMSQFRTQDQPTFCGISSLTMVLNSLPLDPQRIWKESAWRFYSEESLNCCIPLEKVQEDGISFDALACLAMCNGARVETFRATDFSEQQFRQDVKEGMFGFLCHFATHGFVQSQDTEAVWWRPF